MIVGSAGHGVRTAGVALEMAIIEADPARSTATPDDLEQARAERSHLVGYLRLSLLPCLSH